MRVRRVSYLSVAVIDSSNTLPLAERNSIKFLRNGECYQHKISSVFRGQEDYQ